MSDPCQEQCQTQLTCTNSTQRSHANITLKGETRLRRGLTLCTGEISLRLPAPSWEGELVLLLQLFGSSFTGYIRAVPGPSCRCGSRWDLLSQLWEFAMGLLVGCRDIPSPAGSCTRGWEHSVPCCGMSGLPSRCLCTERSSFSVPRTSPVSYTYAKFSPCSILW